MIRNLFHKIAKLFPENNNRIEINESSFRFINEENQIKIIEFYKINEILVETNNTGPIGIDVSWIIKLDNFELKIPQGSNGEDELISIFKTFSSFRIKGMNSIENKRHLCWTRSHIKINKFPSWGFDFEEFRMAWYNITATRTTGNIIRINGVQEDEGMRKIITDIVDFELNQKRTNVYWNEVFISILEENQIEFTNNIEPDENFGSWEIRIGEHSLIYDNRESWIMLKNGRDEIYFKRLEEFNGQEFYSLIDELSTTRNKS